MPRLKRTWSVLMWGRPLRREDSLDLLDLDSLSMAEFSVELERAFGVRVDEQILEVRTVGELSEYIRSLRPRPLLHASHTHEKGG